MWWAIKYFLLFGWVWMKDDTSKEDEHDRVVEASHSAWLREFQAGHGEKAEEIRRAMGGRPLEDKKEE